MANAALLSWMLATSLAPSPAAVPPDATSSPRSIGASLELAPRRAAASAPEVVAPRVDAPPPRRGWLKAERLSPRKRKGARAMLGAGCGLMALTYLGGTLTAAMMLDEIREDGIIEPHERDQQRISGLMFIPVIGPFASAPLASSKGDTAALVGHGVLQSLAASYIVVGSVMLARDARARRWALSAAPTTAGGTVALTGRF